jgi:hypothetical protein
MALRDLAGRVLVLGVLIAAAGILWVLVGRTLMHPETVHEPPGAVRPNAIVWADRVFASRASLAAWLGSHGETYPHWAKLHKVDAAIIEHRRPPAQGALRPPTVATHQHSQHSSSRDRAAVKNIHSATRGTSPGSNVSFGWVRFVLLALAAMVILAAAVPQMLVRLTGGDWFSATRRTYLVAVGLSLCVGALVTSGH